VKRPLHPDELRIWGLVAGTVRPLPGRTAPAPPPPPAAPEAAARIPPPAVAQPRSVPPRLGVDGIEPNRRWRIAREREPIGARLDLHGLDQDRAWAVLEAFLRRAHDEGLRAVLVITGKGTQGPGVLRRRVPEWLAAPHLAHIVAGVSEATWRHGGEGALYVALKRKRRA
jgi:DNA-nicking Smr family endonuclease